MVDCDAPWTGFIMVTAMLVVPFAVPTFLAAVAAWRGASPLGARVATGIAFAAVVVWTLAILDHPGDPRWLPLLFAPALVSGVWAVLAPGRPARVALLAGAAFAVLGGLAYAASLRLAYEPCF